MRPFVSIWSCASVPLSCVMAVVIICVSGAVVAAVRKRLSASKRARIPFAQFFKILLRPQQR